MYHGKHEKSAKGIKKYKKSGILLASIVLILALTIGTTVAFLIDVTNPVQNIFNPSEVTVDIEEVFNDNEKSSVKLKNTGDIPAYVRATVAVYWTLNGEVVPAPANFNVTVSITDNWFEVNEIYYHKDPVSVGALTNELLASPVKLTNIPAGYVFHMEVLGEAIQAEPERAVEAAWDDVNVSGGVLGPA